MSKRSLRTMVWTVGLALMVCTGLGLVWYVKLAAAARSPKSPLDLAVEEAATVSQPLLDEEQRHYLWEIEHHGLLLNRKGFTALAKALRESNVQALTELLAPDFTGQTLRNPREVGLETDTVQVVRRQDVGNPPVPLDRSQFVSELLELRRLFGKPPQIKLALMALTPTTPGDLDSLWEGTCLFRMWGETQPGKPGEVIAYWKYRMPRPTETGLARGGWLQACAITQTQVGKAAHYLLREVAAERGIDPHRFHDNWEGGEPKAGPACAYLCDYDRDGIMDLLILDHNGCVLYKGLPGGKFKDVTTEVHLPNRRISSAVAAFVDLDGDGWEDLILGNQIFRNEEGKRFVDYTSRTNLALPMDASGVALADYDRDGRMDLYVVRPGKPKAASWLDGQSGDSKGNQLWHNKGNWRFELVTTASGTDGGHRSTFSAVWLDANNDGWPDLHVINEFGNGVLLMNQGNGTFRPVSLSEGPSDFGSMGVACGDIDNDGNIDLYIANMYSKAGNRVIGNVRPGTYADPIMGKLRSFVAGSQLWRNQGCSEGLASTDPKFEPMAKQWQLADVGWAYGPVLADLDNDGWLDLYATCGFISQSRTEPDG